MSAQLEEPLPNLYLVVFQDDNDLELETEIEAFSEVEAREAVSHMLGPYASIVDIVLLDDGSEVEEEDEETTESPVEYTSELIEEDPVTIEES